MKIRYLRLLDKYLGFLLIATASTTGRFFKGADPCAAKKIDRILVIKFWGFGSIVLGYDFFQSIRKKLPDTHICVLTLRQNSQIFSITGLFDEIIDIDIRNFTSLVIDSIRTILYLRKKSFDISFDLEFTSRFSALVSYLINAKRRIGFQYDGIWRGSCFTDTRHFREDEKLKSSYLKMASFIKNDAGDLPCPLKLNIKNEQKTSVDVLLMRESLGDAGPIVGMNINASELCLLRRWPKEYFVALSEELIKTYSAHIVFIGSKEDLGYVESTINLIRQDQRMSVHNFAGIISLTQLTYLMTKFRLFISNDSGPLHLAAYLKVPSISFFGPETPLIYGPQGPLDTVFYKNLSCSPCIRIKNYKSARCRNNHFCLRRIKPSVVTDEIRRKKLL